jgi:PAS domain S-box-containing protein
MKKRLVSACAFQELFESMPGMFLVLDREYRVAAASDAFLQSSGLSREGILGRSLFDIYASGDAGHGALRRSMDRAILTGEPDAMAVRKFDITSPEGGAVIRGDRYFGMVNYPVFISERGAAFVIHRVEDLTDFIRLREWCSREKDGMSPSNGEMCAMAAAAYGLSRELAEDNNRLLERNAKLKRELDNLKTKDESRTGRAGKRILVVEDDELVSKFLVSLFKTHGSVDLAYNGADALDRTRERRYDLVISDVRMPLMDGISFFREAAKSDSGLCERIIFYSGALTDIDEKFIRENKLRVLIKPALVPDLMNAAREILTKGEPEPSSPPIE